MKRTILLILGLVMLSWTCARAQGQGPFELAPLGATETLRAVPAFIDPSEHLDGSAQFTWYSRLVNVWALNYAKARPLTDFDRLYRAGAVWLVCAGLRGLPPGPAWIVRGCAAPAA